MALARAPAVPSPPGSSSVPPVTLRDAPLIGTPPTQTPVDLPPSSPFRKRTRDSHLKYYPKWNDIREVKEHIKRYHQLSESHLKTKRPRSKDTELRWYNLYAIDFPAEEPHSTLENSKVRYEPRLCSLESWEVPGTFNGITIQALPDWGSCLDAISDRFATKYNMIIEPDEPLSIRIPGGSTAVSTARVRGHFSFQNETKVYERYFRVLTGMTTYDVVLGRQFLDKTKTLTDFCHRIVKRLRSGIKRGNQLYLLDEQPAIRDRIRCRANGVDASAFPDTGSDLMLVSGDFARRNGFKICGDKRYRTQVELIDGTLVRTDGMVFDAELEFDDITPRPKSSERHLSYDWYLNHARGLASLISPLEKNGDVASAKATFICDLHVIEGLPCDIILSKEFIFHNQVFSRFRHLFHSEAPTHSYPSFDHSPMTTAHLSADNSLLYIRIKATKRPWFSQRPSSSPPTHASQQNTAREVRQTWQEKWDKEECRRNQLQLRIASLQEPLRSQEREIEARRQADWDRRNPPPLPLNDQQSQQSRGQMSSTGKSSRVDVLAQLVVWWNRR